MFVIYLFIKIYLLFIFVNKITRVKKTVKIFFIEKIKQYKNNEIKKYDLNENEKN